MSEYTRRADSHLPTPLASQRERLVQARYQREWSQQEGDVIIARGVIAGNGCSRHYQITEKLVHRFQESTKEPRIPLPARFLDWQEGVKDYDTWIKQ